MRHSTRKGLYCLLAALIVLLASCATTDRYERLTSDDCLILIPMVILNPDNSPVARVFVFKFDQGAVLRMENSAGYGAVFTREPGRSLLAVTSAVEGERMTGNSTAEKIKVSLPYKPGEVVVADSMFVQTIVKIKDHEYSTYWDFQPTTEEVRSRVLDQFSKTRTAASWAD